MTFLRICLFSFLIGMCSVGVTAQASSLHNDAPIISVAEKEILFRTRTNPVTQDAFAFVEKRKRDGVNLSQHLPLLWFLLGLFGSSLLFFFACVYGMRCYDGRLSQPLPATKSATTKRGD